MSQFLSFTRKEFWHILRDWRSLAFLVGLPIAQMLIFGFALSNEIKEAPFGVLDHARDEASLAITQRIDAGQEFAHTRQFSRIEEAETAFRRDEIKAVLVFPPQFGQSLTHAQSATVQLLLDASDPNLATSLANFATSIVRDYQQEINHGLQLPYSFAIETRMLYNPQLRSAYMFVPGVMTLILMLIGSMMTAVAIVREKEQGTMEVLLVSPVRPLVLAASKMAPYLLVSFVNLANILLLSYFVLDVPLRGSLLLLLAECILYLMTTLAMGLLISTITSSQQVALFVSLIGLMLPTLIFSGFMFPIENMPQPMQWVSNLTPARWFFTIVSGIMIKGLGWASVWRETLVLLGMTLVFMWLSVRNFQIRLA